MVNGAPDEKTEVEVVKSATPVEHDLARAVSAAISGSCISGLSQEAHKSALRNLDKTWEQMRPEFRESILARGIPALARAEAAPIDPHGELDVSLGDRRREMAREILNALRGKITA